MCADGGFAIFGIAISIAAYNIAKLYFDYKKGSKDDKQT